SSVSSRIWRFVAEPGWSEQNTRVHSAASDDVDKIQGEQLREKSKHGALALFRACVPQGEREVTNQPMDTVLPPALICGNDDLAVGRAVPACQIEGSNEIIAIVDTGVRDEDQTGLRAHQGLNLTGGFRGRDMHSMGEGDGAAAPSV